MNERYEMSDDFFFDESSLGESTDLSLPVGSPTNTAESAPSFYQQMQSEIQALRNKVDRQLSDMVLSSTLELKALTDTMKNLKEKDNHIPPAVVTHQFAPTHHRAAHPNSPGSLRELASPRNRPQQPVYPRSHSNALSITSSASSRLREDVSRDITEPTTNLTRYAKRRQKSLFEAQSSTSSASSRLNEVVSHDITEPTTNLTRYANPRRQTALLQTQSRSSAVTPSTVESGDSSVCKEIVIRSKSPSKRLAGSTVEQDTEFANDRLGQINEVEDEDESFAEHDEQGESLGEYEEIHSVTRKQHKDSRRRTLQQLQPITTTKPSSTRRGAAYEKYRTLNKETLLRPWRQKKNFRNDNVDMTERGRNRDHEDNEQSSSNKSEHHHKFKHDLQLLQMVSSDDVSTQHPEESIELAHSLSPIYDKARISVQYTAPSDSPSKHSAHSQNRVLSPSEKVYRQHESEIKKKGKGSHWDRFSLQERDLDRDTPEYADRKEPNRQQHVNPVAQRQNLESSVVSKKESRRQSTVSNIESPRQTFVNDSKSPKQNAVSETKSPGQNVVSETKSPRKIVVSEAKSPRQSSLSETKSPRQIAVSETKSPRQSAVCESKLPRQSGVSETKPARQSAMSETKPPRQIDDPPDTKSYDKAPQRLDDPPSTVECSDNLLPTNSAKLLRAALSTSDQCAITIYPSTGVYHDAIVLKTYNAEEEKKEEEPAMIVKDNGEKRVRLEQVENKTVRDPYGDYGVFTGLLLKGLPYGQGSMTYTDGRTYVGEWRSGRWHGQGKTTFSNGDVYVGEYYMDKRHGIGRYEWKDGRVYDGEFDNDQREGRGTYSFPDSSVYTGEFHKGLRHGQGCYKFADSSMYNGGFKNGKYDGVGECIWADGRCYRGEWKDGWAHGYGVEMRADGSIRHDGEWKRDKPVKNSRKMSKSEGHVERRSTPEADRYTVVYMKEEASVE